MKKHLLTIIASALLAGTAGYAQAAAHAPGSARSEKSMQFAEQFAGMQAASSNSSAFMRGEARVSRSPSGKPGGSTMPHRMNDAMRGGRG
jgi:hypothetical protein